MRFIFILHIFTAKLLHAQVGVNILSPHASAAMQVESPAGFVKGLLTPSMTTTSRMAITSGTLTPADGLIVYDVNHQMHYYYTVTEVEVYIEHAYGCII